MREASDTIYPPLRLLAMNVHDPALIVWGREDRIVPVQCGEQYRALLPNARLEILEGCGHLPPIEQPDAFATLVTEFLG